MSTARQFRTLIHRQGVLSLPGVHDGLSVRLARQAGFEAGFVSGAGLAFARYGTPDLGLISLSELAASVGAMTEQADLPLLVDIDTGFGNALNVQRTVRLLESAGAAGLQMEDQTAPKRCGHLAGKQVIPAAEMAGKIRAACDARRDADLVVIARTDAIAVTGFDDALERAELYLEAGADALFIEAPATLEQMQTIAGRFADRIPLVHNLVAGGRSPVDTADALAGLGYRIALFPLACLQAAMPATRDLLEHLAATGDTQNWPGAQSPLADFNAATELDQFLVRSKDYAAGD